MLFNKRFHHHIQQYRNAQIRGKLAKHKKWATQNIYKELENQEILFTGL